MGETDFTFLTNVLDTGTVDRGVTAGVATPNGGGSFVFGFNSLAVAEGAVALFTNQANFAPMTKGCSIRGCIKRAISGGNEGWSPYMFVGLQGPDVGDYGYLLGLEDNDPYRIVLRKGTPLGGCPSADEDPNTLRTGSQTHLVSADQWHHLRLDMIVNLTTDVVLKAYVNDLSAQPIGTTPDWQPVPGLADFLDDALGINSGSQPFQDGRAGFGIAVKDTARRAYFDQLEIARQL